MPRSHKDPAAYSGLRIEIRDKIEAKLMGSMTNHHRIGICSTQQFIAKLELVVDFLR